MICKNLLNDDVWTYQSISVIISIAAALLVTAGDSFQMHFHYMFHFSYKNI